MPRSDMLMVFTYDVSVSRNRRRVSRVLEDHATRVQYSVFEAWMSEARAAAVAQRAADCLGDGDSLRVYAIGNDGRRRSRVYGDGAALESQQGYWLC